ncbi:MAG: ABC transporter substrate-binding protein [Anaerolineales bacterium]|nr:ABC transporter substrate-binding protein [Anaerolineales bacterium]
MSKRILVIVSILVLASLVLAACQPAATEAPAVEEPAAEEPAAEEPAAEEPAAEEPAGTLKIAILAPLSGSVPTFGVSTRDGALLAIKEWNEKGGVLGMQIETVVEDSQCEADPSVNAANKVIDQDGVKFIIGEVCSKASIPISEIAQEKGIVQISPTSTNETVTLKADGSTKEYVFRACFIDPFQGKVGAKFALDNLGAKNAFILFDQGNDYVRGLAEAFEATFTDNGGTVVGKETYTVQDTDFSAILAKVSEANPDVVYLPDYYNIINLVTAQAKEKGITAPFMGGDGWDSADLDRAASDGGYYTNHYSDQDTRQIVQDWVSNYEAEYGAVPDALATLAYDAANLLIAAIEEAGEADPAKVKDSLAAISWEGVSGTITYDEFHNPIKAAVILQVKDGEIVYVATVAP